MMILSKNSTLFYTSSEPMESDPLDKRNNPGSVYSCALEEFGERCVDPQRHAIGLNTDVESTDSGWFSLMNLQLSEKEASNGSDNSAVNDDGKDTNYALYASTLKEHPEHEKRYSWKIVRANMALPFDSDHHGNLQVSNFHHFFKPYFRTISEFDWNNCNFGCCPFGNNVRDSNRWTMNRTRDELRFQHAYIRVKPRAYAVDHETGEIFIAWEGFYKNCIQPKPSPIAEWSIGISRLLTNKECVSSTNENGIVELASDFGEFGNNFVGCTEPVTIVDVDNRNMQGRKTGLSYGGFAVVPAAKEAPSRGVQPRRSFLLSVFKKEQAIAPMTYLWAIPEGVDASQAPEKRQTISSTKLSQKFEFGTSIKGGGSWNGGNIKVHYSQQTGLPDYLCRSVFSEGISCVPVAMTENGDSVKPIGNEVQFLSKTQVQSFCDTGQVFQKISNSTENTKRAGKYVGGLDILWNEEDSTPFKCFFGCVGIEKNGRLGSVDWYGGNVIEVLPDAYSGDVLLIPGEPIPLGYEISPSNSADGDAPDFHVVIKTDGDFNKLSWLQQRRRPIVTGIIIGLVLTLVFLAAYVLYRKCTSSVNSSSNSKSTTISNSNDENHPTEVPNDGNLFAEFPDDEILPAEIPSAQNV